MKRSARAAVCGFLLIGTALQAGCGSAGGLTTQSVEAADVPGGITNESPLARPIAVAWTSARAQRCGFYFDAAKLKASYLAFEAKQQASADQLAKVQKAYDTTMATIRERATADPDYCTDRKGTEIKADLQRHLAGDFAPNFPKAKVVESCGFFGCPQAKSEEKFDAKRLFDDLERKANK